MGTRSSSKLGSARGVSDSIKNSKSRINNFRAFFRLLVFLCVLGGLPGNLSAQVPVIKTEDLDANFLQFRLTQTLQTGTAEKKRDALFEIRNLRSEIYSRIALPALRDSSEIVRATAAFAVIYLPKDEAFGALVPNLQDKAELVRRETAYALGKIQNPAAVNPLIQTFQKDKSLEVQNACLVALGEIGDAAAVDFLTGILRQKPSEANEFRRRSAARSLGQIAQIIQTRQTYTVTPESFLPEKFKSLTLEKYRDLAARSAPFRAAVPVLSAVLQNKNEADDTRREAAFALGAIGDRAALAVLENNLGSKDYYLAEICRESIKKLSTVE